MSTTLDLCDQRNGGWMGAKDDAEGLLRRHAQHCVPGYSTSKVIDLCAQRSKFHRRSTQ